MNKTRHRFVAAIVLRLPVLALAQGYKCKLSDGSVSYHDHACMQQIDAARHRPLH